MAMLLPFAPSARGDSGCTGPTFGLRLISGLKRRNSEIRISSLDRFVEAFVHDDLNKLTVAESGRGQFKDWDTRTDTVGSDRGRQL